MSPCNGICDLVSNPSRFCRSCGRTYSDVYQWKHLGEEVQKVKSVEAAERLREYKGSVMPRPSQAAASPTDYYPAC
jgi:predicted Fe-S protein YdhL (DUF1289 family)